MVKHAEIKEYFTHPRLGVRVDLFIGEDQGSYYNTITDLNYLSQT
jgi:hypothetical protein